MVAKLLKEEYEVGHECSNGGRVVQKLTKNVCTLNIVAFIVFALDIAIIDVELVAKVYSWVIVDADSQLVSPMIS